MKPYRVLLYYIYTPIENPAQYRDDHHRLCLHLNLLGRVIVAPEGLNGTVSGRAEDCEAYMNTLRAEARFVSIDFKVEQHETHAFQKLHVRLKEEIVHSDLPVNPLERTGIHLEPADFQALKNDPDVVLVDMRSNYEHTMGRFKNAVTFDMENLRDLPDHIGEIEHLKNKKIITYCTGGIKCEKASAYLLSRGFETVYQLHGGIIKYGMEVGGEDFEGQCYVFDNRLAVDVNAVNPSVVSVCYRCQTPTTRLINCASPACNNHLPLCEACGDAHGGTCTDACKTDPALRQYDGTGCYGRRTENYSPRQVYRSQTGSLAQKV